MTSLSNRSALVDHAALLITLCQAASNAAQSGCSVLASFTIPIDAYDPLSVFSAFRQLPVGESFFWEKLEDQKSFVGTGVTLSIETGGTQRFQHVEAAWQILRQNAVIRIASELPSTHKSGPILFGGFSFDPFNSGTQLWDGFPAGQLVLPYLLFTSDPQGATLTICIQVGASDNVEQYASQISSDVFRLYALLERPTTLSSPDDWSPVILDLISPSVWKSLIRNIVQSIQSGVYEKVVLARSVQVICADPLDIGVILDRLRTGHPHAYVFAIQRGTRYFMGATPECLVRASDGQIQTMALAGSAPRGTTQEEDQRLGMDLLHNGKNHGEHTIVVTMICNALKHLCSSMTVADVPELLRLQNIQHLQTLITGDLFPGQSILGALQALHPTPAVGGSPRELALSVIRNNECLDRGWYSGPIGWIDTNGDGEFAVALRSGLIDGATATLFAGCGIVADSNPESEYTESCLKFAVMLQALSPHG